MISKVERTEARKRIALLRMITCESRFLIIGLVHSKKKLTVQNIADALGMTHSAVSHQLSILAKSGVLACTREGREAFYHIAKSPVAIAVLRMIKA